MSHLELILQILAIALVALATFAFLRYRVRREQHAELTGHFGGEYERVLAEEGSTRRADRVLRDRVVRAHELSLRPLDPSERIRFQDRWARIQQRFIDTPAGAVREAQDLVLVIMAARGYPEGSVTQRLEDLSVYHPALVEHFREASALARGSRIDDTSTEQLRKATIHYRVLVDELLEDDAITPRTVRYEDAPRPA